MTQFCAYVQARPDTADASGIFYVGKGTRRRAQNLKPRNPYHGNVVAKYGSENILVGKLDCSSEEIAFDLEKGLIKCLRRMGVKLTNQTDGGEGASGLKFSEEARAKISAAGRGRRFSDTHKAKIGDAGRGRKHTAQAISKMRSARLGKASPLKGKTHTPEARAKLRTANLGKQVTNEAVKKMKDFWVGRVHVNNGVVTRRVLPNEVPEGFVLGRLTSGKIWINDGIISRQVLPSEIPEGFTRGRLKAPQRVKSARSSADDEALRVSPAEVTKQPHLKF